MEMIKKTYWIFCDGCGAAYGKNGTSIKEVRQLAKNQGWKFSRFTGDLCPFCQATDRQEWKDHVRASIDA